jgi:outer membrane receptor protein involved in Fe transport
VPVDPVTGLVDLTTREEIDALINGEIDETRVLPSAGLAYRPLEGLVLRGAWYSQSVARPSFREIGYYVSVEPGSTEVVVGNPQLELSDVESYDARAEYTWGDFGDLVALSAFYKEIERPIESILLFNPVGGAQYRTFFNNPNDATLWGLEAEARKSLDFLYFDVLDFLQYLSVGGNYTWIDAEVDRSEEELARSTGFFGVPAGQSEAFSGLKESRRLFGQPEWIANADVSFDHPDWGTRVTLAWFAISDVLDAAGSGQQIGSQIGALTLDRYIDSFHQLDLIASQSFSLPLVPGEFALKFSAKNLTDSTRKIVYDPEQTREEIAERAYRVGRDYSLSLQYKIELGGR